MAGRCIRGSLDRVIGRLEELEGRCMILEGQFRVRQGRARCARDAARLDLVRREREAARDSATLPDGQNRVGEAIDVDRRRVSEALRAVELGLRRWLARACQVEGTLRALPRAVPAGVREEQRTRSRGAQ